MMLGLIARMPEQLVLVGMCWCVGLEAHWLIVRGLGRAMLRGLYGRLDRQLLDLLGRTLSV